MTRSNYLTPAFLKGWALVAVMLVLTLLSRGQTTVQVVTLDGSKSFDPEGGALSYQWIVLPGAPMAVTIANPAAAITTAVPANGLQWLPGVYKFQLTVTDNLAAIGRDTMQVTVSPNPDKPPVVNAGVDQSTQLPKDSVNLQGAATDPDGTVNLYQWTLISGPNAPTITSANAAVAKVKGLIVGTYFFRLKATDNLGASAADTVKVTVIAANLTPKSDAGPDQTVTLPVNTVALGGPGDVPFNGAEILWVKVSGPAGDRILSPATPYTSVTGLSRGVFVYQKQVRFSGQSVYDRVTVTVKKKRSWWQSLFGS